MMKKFIFNLIFILLVSIGGYSQTLTSPTSQEVPVGVNGIGVSGFSLSGYNPSTIYKVSLSITGNANAIFSVNTTAGLTRDFGFNSWTNITSVNFSGTPTNIQNGLNSIKLNTTSTVNGIINLSVVITSQVTGAYYNPTNGHIYRFIQGQYTISQARSDALASNFEGVPGYLVTITSADEQNFINSKVSAFNVWTGLSDEQQEGYWRWLDGPEAGTVIRIGSNNVSGQYNNWAPGEPNNWGPGEDYMVMKWSGGTQWNDFGPPATTTTSQIGGYLVEYGTWTDPTQSTFNSTQQTQITFTQKNIPYLTYQFNFDSDINPTQWSGMVHYEEQPNQYNTTHTTPLTLALNGYVNATPQVFPKGPDGTKKATTIGGQVEWAIIDVYSTSFGGHRLYIDGREFDGTGVSPSDVTSIQLFDIYDGPITFAQDAGGWKIFRIVPNISSNILSSNYQSYLRLQNGWYGTKAEFSFINNESIRKQSWIFSSKTQNEVQQLVDDVVTVSDVVLAFNEIASGGLNGGLKGDLAGIQLALGDINRDGIFDFQDTYRMLEHLTGTNTLLDVNSLAYFMVIREKPTYEGYTKQNWSDGSWTSMMADSKMTESALVQQLQYNIGFKGDVNLSHSMSAPSVTTTSKIQSQGILNKSTNDKSSLLFDVENGNDIIVTLTLSENQKNIIGTQFRLAFDNSKLSFNKIEYTNTQIQNFQTTRSDYINFGSISPDKSKNLNGGIEYKIYFKPNTKMDSILGLVSLVKKEVIDSNGTNLEIQVK